jgi:hypothetical protein
VLATDARIDVEKNEKYAPVTNTSAAPVDGTFLVVQDDITAGRSSGTFKDEMV